MKAAHQFEKELRKRGWGSEGIERAKALLIFNYFLLTNLSMAEIAARVGVTVDFVRRVHDGRFMEELGE